jgi:hypothetical protein
MSSVNDFVGPNEEVRFVGTYDIKRSTVTPDSNENFGFIGRPTEVAGICGYGLINNSYNYVSTGLVGAPRFIYEQYSLATVDVLDRVGRNFLGNCVWEGSYPDVGSLGVTDTSVFAFGVSSSTGVYTGVKKVVIDFTNDNRVLYFVVDKL